MKNAKDQNVKMRYMKLVLYLLIACSMNGQSQSKSSTLIKDVQCIDVIDGSEMSRQDVLISDGLISRIDRYIEPDEDVKVIDGKDQWLLPGLIDAHIHLFQSGGLYARPDAIDLRDIRAYEEEVTWTNEQAPFLLQSYLKKGITSVLDMGGPFSNFKVRDNYIESKVHPNLFLTGPLISTYEPVELKTDDAPILRVESEEEARSLVRKQIPFKPDFIKIWYIALPTMTAMSTFDIVSATIDESHHHGLPVAVHATQLNTAKLAIKAGADILVHSVAGPIDDEFISMLLDSQVAYIPTLTVHANYDLAFMDSLIFSEDDYNLVDPFILSSLIEVDKVDHPNLTEALSFAKPMLAQILRQNKIRATNLKKLIDAGVNIATGTDAGNIGTLHASSFQKEIEAMQDCEISNFEIIKSSTISAAKALGKEQALGSIEVGKHADLLLLASNPLNDLSALEDINYVLKDGYLIDPDTLLQDTPEQLAQRQLNAYNNRDIEAFLHQYSDSVKVFGFPDILYYQGKTIMRDNYKEMFEQTPNLHCKLVNRIVLGNTVIDQELVTGIPGREEIRAIAIYKIRNGKIQEVYFDRGE